MGSESGKTSSCARHLSARLATESLHLFRFCFLAPTLTRFPLLSDPTNGSICALWRVHQPRLCASLQACRTIQTPDVWPTMKRSGIDCARLEMLEAHSLG